MALNMNQTKIYEQLGLDDRLPQTAMPPRYVTIGGFSYLVHVTEAVKGSRRHRVMVTCTTCQKVLSAGRLHQHKLNGRC
jgi:hypothetical protein